MTRVFKHIGSYTSRDVAGFCDLTLDHFYRVRERLHQVDRLPRPFKSWGRLCFDRALIDAWRAGQRIPVAANDVVPIVPASDDEHRARLQRAYGAG